MTEVLSGENAGVSLAGADRRGESGRGGGAIAGEDDQTRLPGIALFPVGRDAWTPAKLLLPLFRFFGSAFDHQHIGARASEEDGNERPKLNWL